MHNNSMKTLVFGQNQRNMKYAFSAASRKAKKYAFSLGTMHISEKSWNHQKCIIQRNVDLDNRGSKRFCSQPKSKRNMHFPMENAYF